MGRGGNKNVLYLPEAPAQGDGFTFEFKPISEMDIYSLDEMLMHDFGYDQQFIEDLIVEINEKDENQAKAVVFNSYIYDYSQQGKQVFYTNEDILEHLHSLITEEI